MPHPLFTPEARLLLEKNDTAAMEAFCETLHPATVAESLSDDAFRVEDVWRFLNTTTIANQADFRVFSAGVAGAAGRGHGPAAHGPTDRADVARRSRRSAAPPGRRKVVESLLRLVDEADRRDIATLVEHPENTAGALMTTDYAWLPANSPSSRHWTVCVCRRPTAKRSITSTLSMTSGGCSAC